MIFKKCIFLILILPFPVYSNLPTNTQKKTEVQNNRSAGLNSSIENKTTQKGLNKSDVTINSITIKTENKKLKSDITKILFKYNNKVFSKKLSDKIYKTILSVLLKKKILDPKLTQPFFYFTDNKIDISYEIKNPYRYGFILKKNKAFQRYHLLSKKHYKKYFNNNQFIRKILLQIKRAYLKKAYTNISLDYEIKTDEKHFIRTVLITVDEGKQTKIEKIQIFGKFSRKNKFYINLIKKHSSSLVQKKMFYNVDVQKGVKNLVNSLKNEGYLEATAYTRITNNTNSTVIIDVILNEGPLTQIKEITFQGNKSFSDQELMSFMKLKVNGGLNLDYLEHDIQELVSFYRKSGFIEMELNNKNKIVQYNKKDSSATVLFNIVENNKIKVFDILVKGNTRTKKEFILRNLSLKKGDVVTPEKIDFSVKKLRNLGIFSSINILTKKEEKTLGNKTLIVQVEERKHRSLRMALGVNTQRTLTARGFAEFSNRNITGVGRHFFSRVRLQSNIARYIKIDSYQPQYLEHQASVSYMEPFLMGLGFHGQVSLSNSSEIFSYERVQGKDVIDIVNSTKINFLLKRTINQFINLKWTLLSWEARKDFKKTQNCETSTSRNDPNITVCENRSLNIATTGVALNIDKRDNILSTTNGFLSQLSVEYSGPFYFINSSDEIKFVKMEVKHFDFRSIFNDLIWVNSIQGGFIANMNNLETGGFPVSRAFILGGVNSLRGFDGLIHGERVPDKEEFPIDNANEIIYSRSSFYLLLKTEFRFPFSKSFKGSLFYDGGIVTISGKAFKNPYRQSVGLGLRYQTPLGPVSLYVAAKISPKENESIIFPHLSFGSF